MADCDFEIEEQLVERKVTLNILPCLGRQGQQFPVGEVDKGALKTYSTQPTIKERGGGSAHAIGSARSPSMMAP